MPHPSLKILLAFSSSCSLKHHLSCKVFHLFCRWCQQWQLLCRVVTFQQFPDARIPSFFLSAVSHNLFLHSIARNTTLLLLKIQYWFLEKFGHQADSLLQTKKENLGVPNWLSLSYPWQRIDCQALHGRPSLASHLINLFIGFWPSKTHWAEFDCSLNVVLRMLIACDFPMKYFVLNGLLYELNVSLLNTIMIKLPKVILMFLRWF